MSSSPTTLGFETKDYETKFHMIDNQLLAKRNNVAHGRDASMDPDSYLALHDGVLAMMEQLRAQIENAGLMGAYLKRPHDEDGVVGSNQGG